METKTVWPGKAKDKPENWKQWSEEAQEAFAELWKKADAELKKGLLEDTKEKKGNQKEMESYFIFLNEHKEIFDREDEEEFGLGGAGCSMIAAMILLLAAILIPLLAT